MENIEPGIVNDEIITGLQIDYEPDSQDPGRIFRAMAQMIDAMHALDVDLAVSISTKIKPVQVLHEIEAGSLKTWLKTVLEHIPDEALRDLNWKVLVGQFLVKGKRRTLKWLGGRDYISNAREIDPLERDLLDLAKETHVLHIPTYAEVPRARLLKDLEMISNSTQVLSPTDKVKLITHEGDEPINTGFRLASEDIEDLLTKDIEKTEVTLTLLIKKPDYLGESMWEVYINERPVDAKIKDKFWLERFHNREVIVRPRDAIRAKVEIVTKRAEDGTVIGTRYNVLKVLEVIRADDASQIPLIKDE
jgi:hypothetical protein